MRFAYYILFVLICSSNFVFSQQISVDNSIGLQQLIEDNLVQNSCVEISSITSSVNGNSFGLPSYAYFNRASSNFPFQDGIMLSTGNAASGGNSVITPTLSEGSSIWGSDPDLDAALGNTNYVNATSIEFDIISISNQIQFNYLFASEDYDDINPCLVADGFVFLIKETASAAPYQNIALVPGTGTNVNTNTIRPNLLPACAAQNDQYFDGYNIGDTNYEGRTTALTASTTIIPYVQYHIKLIIADQIDGRFDSAVFIEGNSFNILDLGDDIETCAGSTPLNADIQNAQANYRWFLNNSEIVGEINSTLNAIQSGTYRVEITVPLNNTDCVEEDEIVVVLNTEESITPITNYELCDDISGDSIEIFDLSTKDAELIANVPFSNFSFTYHPSNPDARNNINSITTPIPNTTNPQPIFVRIHDLDSNCFAYTSFNLIVNSVPNIIAPTDLEVCDGDDTPDGYAVIDLTQKDNEITANQSNLIVSYHYNLVDVSTGNNPILTPYINTNTPSDLIYVRVTDTQTGCVNTTTTLNVNITTSPIVNRDTQFIDACDTDQDGTANFNLTEVLNDVLTNVEPPNIPIDPSTVNITFHETFQDAQDGINPIADETNYQNINPNEQTVYIRIEDNITGCFSIVPLEIHTNLLLTGTNLGDFALCDTNDDANDTLDFNLNTVQSYIANDLPNNIIVTFYETVTERDSDTNPIDKTALYAATSPATLYIKLTDTDSACSEVWDITLLVNPILLFNPVAPIQYCDTDNDGTVSVELATLDDIITGGNPNFTVSYFAFQPDADNNINQLPPFHPVTGLETLFARLENIDTECSTTNSFDIQVNLAPAATTPTPIVICDNNQDGFSVINFVSRGTISEITPSTVGLTIDFFTTSPIDKDTTTDIIPDITAFNASTQTIYIRVKNNDSQGCYNIVPLDIIVNTLPIFPAISNFQICQTGGSTADFLLVDKDAEILDDQTGKEVFYFEDAAFTIPIPKNIIYQNTSSPQTVYVRVENISDASCFGASSFILQVSPDPVYNVPTPYLKCDDISNDEISNFDLNEKVTEIKQGATEILNVSFHLTQLQAEDNLGALSTDNDYTNIENPQTLFVRIESDDSLCYIIEELHINIIEAPDLTQTQPFELCDTDYDGEIIFDLTLADFEILDRIQTNLITNYFENVSDINPNDGLDNTNQINNPSIYSSSSRTVYIKVANTLTGCYSTIPLELIVNTPPPTNTIGTIEICDNETDTYDLSQVDPIIVNDPSIPIISYHNTNADAINNISPIGNTFNYTSNNHIIHARVSDATTGCYIVQPFNLQINPNPIANTTPDLISCDDDFDDNNTLVFNLAQHEDIILGGQDVTNFSVAYYTDSVEVNTETPNISPLNVLHPASNGETIYARVENNTTGCFDVTEFNIRINPKPEIPIDDIVTLCSNDLPLVIDAYTGNPNDTYLWSTGATTPQILLNDANIRDYWVTATTPNIVGDDCSSTHSFTVIESQQAINIISIPVDFSDPNSITVNVEGIGDYEYILDGGEPQKSNVFNNVTLGAHIVTIIDLNGCMPVDEPVFVIDIPKFVTPNNDNYFDTWHIVGINQLPGTVVYIYNRYGKLLKTLPHTALGWDGTFNGENMPSDDYWFVAKVIQGGNAFDIKGHFALKR